MRTTTLKLLLAVLAAAIPATAAAQPCDKNHYILTDLSDCHWILVGAMSTPRANHTATLLADGRVLVVGGIRQPLVPSPESEALARTVEIYHPQTRSFQLAAPTHYARLFHAAVLLPDGRVLVAGGDVGEPFGTAEIYDPAADTWQLLPGRSFLTPRMGPEAMLLADGRVIVTGGGDGIVMDFHPPEYIDTAEGTWTIASAANVERIWHSATALGNGSILWAGGASDDWLLDTMHSAMISDASGAFRAAASMHGSRAQHSAVLLPDGRVLVAGGHYSYVPIGFTQFMTLRTTEIYDPATDTWSVEEDLIERRMSHAAVQLADGTTLVTGGVRSHGGVPFLTWSALSSVEMRRAGGGWRLIGGLNEPRYNHSATRLTDGTVLVIGGSQDNAVTLESAELLGAGNSLE